MGKVVERCYRVSVPLKVYMLYNWIFSLQSAVHFSLSEMQPARYVHNLPRHLVNALRVIPAVTDAAILEYYRVD